MSLLLDIACVDEIILNRCEESQQRFHKTIGLMLLFLAILSFLGFTYAVFLIGFNVLVSLLSGIILSFIVINFYRFIFITICCKATFDEYIRIKNSLTASDILRFVLIGFIGAIISQCVLIFVYRQEIENVINSSRLKVLLYPELINIDFLVDGFITRIRILDTVVLANNNIYIIFTVLLTVVFLIPLFLKLFFSPLRNGEYEWYRNQLENQRIKDQYEYCKDYYEITIKNTAGIYLRKNFIPEESFTKDPFENKLIDLNAKINLPVAMADNFKDYQNAIEVLIPKTGDKIYQTCDFCGENSSLATILDNGLSRCTNCQKDAVDTESELHNIFAKARLYFLEMNLNMPIHIWAQFANPQEIAKFLGTEFKPTSGYDSRIIGLAPFTKDGNADRVLIEKGHTEVNIYSTMIHELTHIWQFYNLDLNKLQNQEVETEIMLEGLSIWAEMDCLEKIGEHELISKKEFEISNYTGKEMEKYSKGFEYVIKLQALDNQNRNPFQIYLEKYHKS